MRGAGLLVGAVALVGAAVGISGAPQSASAAAADTVCCYRWWGVGTETVKANVTKSSPTVAEVDWSRAYLQGGDGLPYGVTARVKSSSGAGTTGTGGPNTWVTANPTGTLKNAYGQCLWTDWTGAGYSLQIACEMKLRR